MQIGITVATPVYDTPSKVTGIAISTLNPGELVPVVSTFTTPEGTWTQVELPGWGSDMMGNPMAQAGYILTADVQAAGGAIVPISEVGNVPTPIGTIYASGVSQIMGSIGLPATIAGISTPIVLIGLAVAGYLWMKRPSVIVERR